MCTYKKVTVSNRTDRFASYKNLMLLADVFFGFSEVCGVTFTDVSDEYTAVVFKVAVDVKMK